MAPEPSDVTWIVRWAEVLQRIRAGATGNRPIELSPRECRTLLDAVTALSADLRDEERK